MTKFLSILSFRASKFVDLNAIFLGETISFTVAVKAVLPLRFGNSLWYILNFSANSNTFAFFVVASNSQILTEKFKARQLKARIQNSIDYTKQFI